MFQTRLKEIHVVYEVVPNEEVPVVVLHQELTVFFAYLHVLIVLVDSPLNYPYHRQEDNLHKEQGETEEHGPGDHLGIEPHLCKVLRSQVVCDPFEHIGFSLCVLDVLGVH